MGVSVIHEEVFPMSQDQIQEQYKRYNTDPQKVKELEKILEEWYRKQPHLPKELPFDNFFEKAFLMCCYRMDLCKRKIDRHFSYKSHYSEFYEVFGPDVEIVPPSKSLVTFVPMPKLGPNLDRIWVGFVETKNLNKTNHILDSFIQLITACRELTFRYEQTNSITVVADCREHGNGFYYKKDFLQKMLRYALFVYNADNIKCHAVHVVNLSPLWHVFLNMLRTFVPDKLMKRLHIHDSYESLYKAVPKEYLPIELGGTNISTSEILKRWDTLFLENQEHYLGSLKYVSDESKRVGECPINAMFGIEGTFRNLEID